MGVRINKVTAFAVFALAIPASSALAQDGIGPPPIQPSLDENGVDLTTTKQSLSAKDLSIGLSFDDPESPSSVLSVSRQRVPNGWRHNMLMAIIGGSIVNLGTRSVRFTMTDGAYVSLQGTGETLAFDGSVYVFTDSDGTIIRFPVRSTLGYYPFPDEITAIASEMIRPSGEVITFTNRDVAIPGWGVHSTLVNVISSRGYRLNYQFMTSEPVSGVVPFQLLDQIETVSAINSAVEYCQPSDNICQSRGVAWPTASFRYEISPNQSFYYATGPDNNITRYTNVGSCVKAIKPPDRDVDTVLFDTLAECEVTSVTRNGITYSYSSPWPLVISGPQGFNRTIDINHLYDENGYEVDRYSYAISRNVDSLGRESKAEYDNFNRIVKSTGPEGGFINYTYDARGNITETRKVAKSGSGLADIVSVATFPSICENPKTCNKPVSVTDALGNVTSFTYAPEHGGILTKVSPAVNGTQANIRYTYAQRSAWIADGGGGYAPAGAPIWVRTEMRSCRTSATIDGTCAAGAGDEVVISYDYGPDSGPNNLLLRGRSSTADGTTQRVCFGYDALGRRISETKPRAGAGACP